MRLQYCYSIGKSRPDETPIFLQGKKDVLMRLQFFSIESSSPDGYDDTPIFSIEKICPDDTPFFFYRKNFS